MSITTLAELREQFEKRAYSMQLSVDCGSDGDMYSEVAIIAEAPGDREVANKIPLIGGSGQKLWKALKDQHTELRRTNTYVTNVSKTQLALKRGKRVMSSAEVQQWRNLLHWELAQLPNLKYIIVLGDYALQAILGEKGITRWRGSVIEHELRMITGGMNGERATVVTKQVTVVVTFNPAHIIYSPQLEGVFHQDMFKLKLVLKDQFRQHKITAVINPEPHEAIEWCAQMIDEREPVAFDIETMGQDTACVGLANAAYTGMCINFRDLSHNIWSVQDERIVRRNIARVLRECKLVAQNGMFDSTYLWFKDKIRPSAIYFDTMLAHHVLYPSLPHNLGFLCTQYTTHPYYKDDGKSWREGGDIDQYWRYNVTDCCITWACYSRMLGELKQRKLDRFFFEHVMRLQPHLVRMTVGGVLIDATLKQQLREDLQQRVGTLLQDWHTAVKTITEDESRDVNPNSVPQIYSLFYKDLRLPFVRNHNTDAYARSVWLDHPRVSDDVKSLLTVFNRYTTEHKFLSTYAEVKADDDGRMRCEYKQTGVQSAPGRLSSAATMWGSGSNLQNQPQRAYDMFVADAGYRFVYFDLSQAEARIVAYLAMIPAWIDQFERAREDGSYDCHRALASEMFDMPYDDVPTYDRNEDGTPSLRYIAKRCRHGLNYRMGAETLSEVTGLPLHVAREAYRIYHKITPELRVWWKTTIDEVYKTRELVTPMGRPLKFLGRVDEAMLDSVIAFRPQSTIGDKVGQVIYQAEDDPRWPAKARIALNVHDALIALVPEQYVMRCARIMREHAEKPIIVNGYEVVIPAELKVSHPDDKGVHRWSTLKALTLS